MGRYTEIFKLKQMLENANVPFQFFDRSNYGVPDLELYQIAYPEIDIESRVFSAIEGCGTYGGESDKLEILDRDNTIHGGISAEDAFKLIQKYHNRYVLKRYMP